MSHVFPLRPLLKIVPFICGLSLPLAGQQPAAPPSQGEDKKQLRFVCITSLEKQHEVVLASRNAKGEWLELGAVRLRSQFITDWLPAKAGDLHLAVRAPEGLKSICQFKHPATARHALVLLIADPQKNVYRAEVVDPKKMEFIKGSVLIFNLTSQPGVVVLGSQKVSVAPGQRVVAKPGLESNGMYRMLVAYMDAEKKVVPCYDRYIPGNPNSRDMMFLFPDATLGLRVFSLPMFGDLE